VTHEYTILRGGTVLGGAKGREPATAVAWAHDTVLAVGSDQAVQAISRGDSRVVDLQGAAVEPRPLGSTIEPGGRADFAILRSPSEAGGAQVVIAVIEGGRVVEGQLPT
jgi:predicted amidohydrolase YtcJ